MQRETHTTSVTVGGKDIQLETGYLAQQANGSVLLRCGETVIFCSACGTKEADANIDFFPLRVDYQENFSSVGKTSSGYIKRQGRPTERETLMSRLIDRPLRPLFPDGYYNEVQVLCYVWSFDGVHMPDPLAICAASAALVISDIPLVKPIGAVRVGMIDGQFVINPSQEQMEQSKLDLLLAGTQDAVLMIEGYCDFLTEEQVLEAIETGHQEIQKICQTLANWQQQVGKEKRITLRTIPEELTHAVKEIAETPLVEALKINDKLQREEALATIKEEVFTKLLPEGEESPYAAVDVAGAFKKISAHHMRQMILKEKKRSDGRQTTDVRPIDIRQSLLPRAHGSSVFTRGETQTMAICTLGGESMAQRYENVLTEGAHRFYLQYFFPPFSVGEVGRMGSAGRREIGHGKLAERALAAIIPDKTKFPYTIRIESNITESNGSSSMATVCGGCLAMMDAGVPIERPVAGIAMGLILEGEEFAVLSDILGIEDALGDMDFKITGDHQGITAFQMDIKIEGITPQIMKVALDQAKAGREHILDKMVAVVPKHREEISPFAPRIETIQVKPSKIATIIGPGGKQIRAIVEETGATVDINDDGVVSLSSPNLESIERAKAIIQGLTAEVEVGRTYSGKVTSIAPFGVFVEILPGKEGLCHISEFDTVRIDDLNQYIKSGDTISVKVLDINERGQLRLSRKATLLASKS